MPNKLQINPFNKPIAYYHNRWQILSNSNLKLDMTHILDLDLLSLKLDSQLLQLDFTFFTNRKEDFLHSETTDLTFTYIYLCILESLGLCLF